MIESVIEFENNGIYLQDNKPENILIKSIFKDNNTTYIPKIADLGFIYHVN